MAECLFHCPNKLSLSFEDRLSYASGVFKNTLSDREQTDLSEYFGFGDLLIDNIKTTKPFYLAMYVPDGLVLNTVTTDNPDRLDKWLHTIDEIAAKNYPELRFKGFSGGFDTINDRFIVEADFYEPIVSPRY